MIKTYMHDLYATTHVVGYNCNLGGGVSDLTYHGQVFSKGLFIASEVNRSNTKKHFTYFIR